jgi:hypothetical protein
MSSPNLFAKRAAPASAEKKFKKGRSSKEVFIDHCVPPDGADKSLEIVVFHAVNGNYHESKMAWPYYNRNDTKHGSNAKKFLAAVACHDFVHKLTDGNGVAVQNPGKYDIKAFVKTFTDDAVGKIDGPGLKIWFDKIYVPAYLEYIPEVESDSVPTFDYNVNYRVVQTWSDCLGVRNPVRSTESFKDMRRIALDDYVPDDVAPPTFGEWIAQAGKGNRFYALFKPGFLSGKEIHDLGVPECVLSGVDKKNFSEYISSLVSVSDTSSGTDVVSLPVAGGTLSAGETPDSILRTPTKGSGVDSEEFVDPVNSGSESDGCPYGSDPAEGAIGDYPDESGGAIYGRNLPFFQGMGDGNNRNYVTPAQTPEGGAGSPGENGGLSDPNQKGPFYRGIWKHGKN